ncbi:P-loop NTPase family protein [Nocardioides sambongensis]|uniref:CpsD/CapB family tyrosine-protein kinase n=1 Tax=Nocardioides sambongensis TaxID=2589074 RepID=UPI00112BE8D3|nr:CpsD/CapB family tyrosine-protein kinase [Nocardioides sambongensis]
MAVIALTSASASPGVTTTAVGLALLWPRPVVLVDADPTGAAGVLAGYLRGTLDTPRGLIEVALSPADTREALREVVVPWPGTTVSFVAGPRSTTQAPALRDLWEPLADVLAEFDEQGQDVIIDAGRLGLLGSPLPLLGRADVTALLTRTTLPALAAARSHVDAVRRDRAWSNPAVVLVGEGEPYRTPDVSRALELPVIATIADAPDHASVFSRGVAPGRGFDTGPLLRSLQATIAGLRAQVGRSRLALTALTAEAAR